MATITYTGTLTIESCCTCGMAFAMPNDFQKRALDDRGPNGKSFYCPAGHRQWYVGKTDAEKAQERLDAEKRQTARLTARVDQAEAAATHQAARANGYKGALTKVKKRLSAGLCPCCSHEFKDVAAHMRRMHPQHVEPVPTSTSGER